MNFDQFYTKYNGKYVEVTGRPQNQCVDLVYAYIRDVLGKPIIPYTNAEDFPSKISSYGTWIKNTPTGVPPKGAIVVWDFASDDVGHIAIASGAGDKNHFESFDQNWPLKSKCHFIVHTYTGVVGWLIPKGDTMLKQGEYRKYNGVGGELLVHILAPPVAQRVLGNGWGSNLLPIRNIVPNDCSGIQRAFDDYAEAERKKEATYVNKIETLGANIINLESEIASLKEQNETLKANPQVVEKEVEKIIEVDSTKNILQKFVDLIKSLIGKE